MDAMSGYKLEFKLRQQTPMIHFQYDQPGATLRASEVKPKLDRFLVKRAGARAEKWKLGDSGALDYKLRIVAADTTTYTLGLNTEYDIYYGNMGGTEKEAVSSGDITLTIICFIPELREFIAEHISDFFLVTNFGTMQNKGFGSFSVGEAPVQSRISEALKREYGAKCCYVFEGGDCPFRRIKTIYAIMKSGMNFRAYQRSLLFLYMHEKHAIGNEKAWLKRSGMAPAIGRSSAASDGHEEKYVRALLGVGEHLDFKNTTQEDKDCKRDKTEVSISCTSETGEKDKIERLESCIFFKVIGTNVYMIGKRIHPEIFDRKFEFAARVKKDSKISKNYQAAFRPVTESRTLKTPSENEFDIDDFLAYCVKKLNGIDNGKIVLEKFKETRGVKIREVK